MRIKRLAFFGTVILFSICIGLYWLMDRTLKEDDIKKAQDYSRQRPNYVSSMLNRTGLNVFGKWRNKSDQCPLIKSNPDVNIQMGRVYEELKFDNVDGGVWKQGWEITYLHNQWNRFNQLKVFVVPHSHNDPGWKKTFEGYYKSQTRNILNNMVVKLSEDKRRKFIWAEISFFALWWKEISQETQNKVKKLLSDGQLEIVTGGWVMSDEANSHYYSIIEQLLHGHEWLWENLEYRPRFSWSIDPFGVSPIFPMILKHSGFNGLVVQRSHYAVKKYLAENKNLEFNWRQLSDGDGSNQLFTHMMPFYSYDVPHTCGPDPKICCQFDFKRLPSSGMSCPWRVPPQPITDANVAKKSEMLLDQYRKKAQLYSTNVLLVPLGDDFRYDHDTEWDHQYQNYQKIFDYINSRLSTLHTRIQFGTLSDYFTTLLEEQSEDHFPSLSGDFFTYADRDDHYWSGYYTSRPLYKRMDRILASYLRSAEIIFAQATNKDKRLDNWEAWSHLYVLLSQARGNHSLFQHHDGITGTAKDLVVMDYSHKMIDAIKKSQHVIQQSANYLFSIEQEKQTGEEIYFVLDDDQRLEPSKMTEQIIIKFPTGINSKYLTFFNSLSDSRHEVVSLKVENPFVRITDFMGNAVLHEISPICSVFDQVTRCFLLSFAVRIRPLSLVTFRIEPYGDSTQSHVNLKIFKPNYQYQFEDWEKKKIAQAGAFSIHSNNFGLNFGKDGFLKAVTIKTPGSSITLPLNISFVKYSARRGRERSGAYLFLPDGEAKPARVGVSHLTVTEGPIMSRVMLHLPDVVHIVTLYHSTGADSHGIEIQNLVNIASINDNYELAMRFSSTIENNDVFFTDLNGHEIIKRKRYDKLPLQANVYPMPAAAYIEDERVRLTALTGQPLGIASHKEGQLEIMQDRILLQDDNRGLDQPVMDNKPYLAYFRILFELKKPCQEVKSTWGALSPNAELASRSLLYPIIKMVWSQDPREPPPPTYRLQNVPNLPSKLHLVMMHNQRDLSTGLIFKSSILDQCFDSDSNTTAELKIQDFIPLSNKKVYESTLTFNDKGSELDISKPLKVCDNQFKAFIVQNA